VTELGRQGSLNDLVVSEANEEDIELSSRKQLAGGLEKGKLGQNGHLPSPEREDGEEDPMRASSGRKKSVMGRKRSRRVSYQEREGEQGKRRKAANGGERKGKRKQLRSDSRKGGGKKRRKGRDGGAKETGTRATLEVRLAAWNVGGVARKEQMNKLTEWVRGSMKDVVVITETHVAAMAEVEGYTLRQAEGKEVSGKEEKEGERTRRGKRRRKRGIAVYTRDSAGITWVEEHMELEKGEESGMELSIVAKVGEGWIRIIAIYGHQAADKDRSKAHIARWVRTTKRKVQGERVETMWIGDLNETEGEYRMGGKDSEGVQYLLECMDKLGMGRLRCEDELGSVVTNYGTNERGRGTPDWVVAEKTELGRMQGRVEHLPRMKSKHSHERIEVDWAIEGRRGDYTKWVKGGRNMKDMKEEEWQQWRIGMEKRIEKLEAKEDGANGIQGQGKESEKQVGGEVEEKRERRVTPEERDFECARKELVDVMVSEMEKIRPKRKMKRTMKRGFGSDGYRGDGENNQRDKLWSEVVRSGTTGAKATEAWRKYEDLAKREEEGMSKTAEEGRKKAVAMIARTAKSNASELWDVIRKLEEEERHVRPPTVLWEGKGDQAKIVEGEEEVKRAWTKTFDRKAKCTGTRPWDEQWRKEVMERVARAEREAQDNWEEDAKEVENEWDWEELEKKAWKGIKNVAAGPTSITGAEMKRMGEVMRRKWKDLIKEQLVYGCVVRGQRSDVRVPVYKKGAKAETKNYRPVSLMDEDAKILQEMVGMKVEEWEKGGRGVHRNSFGGKKGRDRLMVIAAMKERVRSEQFRRGGGKARVAMLIVDVKSAFPGTWREGLADKFLKRGMPRSLWWRWWKTVRHLEGKTRIGHLETASKVYCDGLNQGAKLAAKEFNWGFEDSADDVMEDPDAARELLEMGEEDEKEDGKGKALAQYVDDLSMLLGVGRRSVFGDLTRPGEWGKMETIPGRIGKGVTDRLEKYAQRNRCNWAKEKTEVIVFGKQSGEVGKNWVELEGVKKVDKASVRLLGEDMEINLYKGRGNYRRVMAQIRRKASVIPYVTEAGGLAHRTVLRKVIQASLLSRVRGGMLMSVLKDTEMERVDSVIGGTVKAVLGLGRGVNARSALYMMKIRDCKTELEHEMLRLFGRMRRDTAGKMVEDLFRRRRKDVEKGEKVGLMPRIEKLLNELEMGEAWKTDEFEEKYGKRWKKMIEAKMSTRWKERQAEWWKDLGKRNGVEEMEKDGLDKAQLRRIRSGGTARDAVQATWILGGLILRDNKNGRDKYKKGAMLDMARRCRLCSKTGETEEHLQWECEGGDDERKELINEVDKQEGGTEWRANGGVRKGFKKLDGRGGSSKRDKRRDGALARFRVEMVRKLEKKWAEKGQVMAVRREDFLKAIRKE
jgi:hypothetical protein